MTTEALIAKSKLAPQVYGIACAQRTWGGPRGIWLECTQCDESHVIVGSNTGRYSAISNSIAAKIFRRHGWRGRGNNMLRARCPKCVAA